MTGEHLTYRVCASYDHYDESAEYTICWRATEADAQMVVDLLEHERVEFGAWARAFVVDESIMAHVSRNPVTTSYQTIQAAIEARCAETVERWPDLTAWQHTSYDVELMSDDPYSRRRGVVKEYDS